MAKFIILAICIGALILLTKNTLAQKKRQENEREKLEGTTNMERDPVCGTFVDEYSSYKAKYYDKVYHFCSRECLEKFKETKQAEASKQV